jgi:hypothetical protein
MLGIGQHSQQAGHMRIVARNQQIPWLSAQAVADPLRRIIGLQVARRRKLRERIARTPKRFGGFLCAQFAAVPHDRRLHAASGRFGGKTLDGLASRWRQWTPRIHFWTDGIAVMNEHQPHRRLPLPLYVLAALLLVLQPVNLAFVMSGLVDELAIRGAGLGVILLARLLAAGLGIAAGLALFQRKPGGVTIAKASLVFSAIVDLVVYATPYVPNNRPPGDATIILIASLIYYAGWFTYLARSTALESL